MTRIELKKSYVRLARVFSVTAVLATMLLSVTSHAAINGEEYLAGGPITLTASEGYISIADGGSIYSWGYSVDGSMQLPGPTLILTQGQEYTITLDNALPAAAGKVSIVFPGHDVTSTSGDTGLLTQEAPSGGSVSYTFTAGEPGTYQYHSGTRPDLQVEMGLYGAIVVRPAATPAGCTNSAYNHADTCFDREYLFLLSEIDLQVHQMAEDQSSGPGPIEIATGSFSSEYWLLNGRAAPDTMAPAFDPILPSQPYNSLPRMHPGEKLLLRVVGAGREMHPFHTHGNHVRVLARDGRLLLSDMSPAAANPAADPLAGPLLFTIPSAPGGTVDGIFEWTGKDLGWDMYGTTDINPHTCDTVGGQHSGTTDPNYGEWCVDHDVPIPVDLPSLSSLAFGGFYSGSPYLGAMGSLPPGEGGLNPDSGFSFMWHSHNERELVNNDVFPGGMMTMLIIEAPLITITE